jgi:Uma2 family endonuclease
MRPASAVKLTYADFLQFPDDGRRHELIDGEHYVTPSPVIPHQRLVLRLAVTLSACLEASGLGEVFVAPLDVVLSDHDVVEPDLLVVLYGQGEILTHQHVRGAPALVVEVLSPGTRRRDEGIKRLLYDRSGVREYWLVNPAGRSVTVYRRGTAFELVQVEALTTDRGGVLTTALLPGLAIDLTCLFAAPTRPGARSSG